MVPTGRREFRSGRMSGPDISVVIPTYQRAHLLGRAVRSVLAAVQPGDEVLVVDDGSTDDTRAVLSAFQDRIRVVAACHSGAGAARNLGIRLARSRWIAFLDSDDEWDPDKLALQRPLLDMLPNAAFLFSDFRVRDEHGLHDHYLRRWSRDPRPWNRILGPARSYSSLADLPAGRRDFPLHAGSLYRALMLRPYIAAQTLVFRKDLGESLPEFAPDLPTYEDWQFFAQLARRGDAIYMDCDTMTQYGHSGPRLSDVNELTRLEARLVVLARVWGNDQSFLREQGCAYREVVAGLERRRAVLNARAFLGANRDEAEHRSVPNPAALPWRYRLLLKLPAPLIHRLLQVYRRRPRPLPQTTPWRSR
jgi:glycosyltransferase involved in cell wall biosynthesis